MLAQSFMSAADLGITEPQRDALQKTLVLLETGKLTRVDIRSLRGDWFNPKRKIFTGGFNMDVVTAVHDCGTAGCIIGTADMIAPGVDMAGACSTARALMDLAFGVGRPDSVRLNDITPPQAARALRSYLTTGDAKWAEAVAA